MLRPVKVLRGVPVLRRIAAAHVAARETEPQVDPRIARLEALFAAFLTGMPDLDLVEMRALFFHFSHSRWARSQLPRRAPASYVLSRNSYSVSSGEAACRTSSYMRMNSPSCVFLPAAAGRTCAFSSPSGAGIVYA